MKTPRYDASVNTTGCCPRFNPEGWDGQELQFNDKRFVNAMNRGVMHISMNMGEQFGRLACPSRPSPSRQEAVRRVSEASPSENLLNSATISAGFRSAPTLRQVD
ncbi:hydrolase [Mesorhizobium sp. M1050]|uniref:hydrolase n=1 Tax=Mesorhizobium sp. M1050 TaxID=2957051 RepID=UPI00333A51AF